MSMVLTVALELVRSVIVNGVDAGAVDVTICY